MTAQATIFAVAVPRSFNGSSKSILLSAAQNATIGNGGNIDAGHIYFDFRSTSVQTQILPNSKFDIGRCIVLGTGGRDPIPLRRSKVGVGQFGAGIFGNQR